jgi:calcineurin-like phosphoesterase family protein
LDHLGYPLLARVQHKNINRYCWRTTPHFPTPESVDRLMVDNWRAFVQSTDTILHLGDLCHWGDAREVPMLHELTGRKLLLKGNHDNYKNRWYADHGFEVVELGELDFHHVCEMGEATVRFTHYPLSPLPPQTTNMHGHVHNNPYHSTPSHLNLSVEVTHYAPVPLQKALDKVMWSHVKSRS